MKNLAIIPARSGSKGVLNKNIRILGEKPLIAYSIEAALKSNCFDEIMVSTDSEKYGEIAIQYGAQVPFLRSKEQAKDSSDSWDVVKEVLSEYRKLGKEFDSVCLLQPTSPLRSSEDIQESYKLFNEKASVGIVSVCEMEHSPCWCGCLPEDNSLAEFLKEGVANRRRQEIEKYYRLNGAIYIVKVDELIKSSFLFREGSFAYVMPINRSVDIDTEDDFLYAEYLLKKGMELRNV